MSHANACLTPRGRLRLARCVVDDGWTYARAAERFQCSTATTKKWADRYRAGGPEAMVDRSSRPHRSPGRLSQRRERRIIKVRFTRRWGPHRIAAYLRLARSTVEAVLRRYRMPLLRHLDQASGLPVRRAKPRRYEHPAPGDLVHLDIKKLGRIPDGGGHRKLGRQAGRRNRSGVGYAFLHHAVDDHSRLAYSEILTDERKDTAAGFWLRANGFFVDHGITVRRVLTDNGNCYRSKAFADSLSAKITHKRTRPYRPQTNGKVERFNRTLASEWAYAQTYLSDADRAATYQDWLHYYNHHRPHTGIGGKTPIDRLRVHNLPVKNT
ncbi:IS481 family transposase [Mycobacterium intracellulare]|uniref:Transposase for ISMyma06 n=8 Tax=Bacteria TaxID=2 RepID=A0A7U5RXK0_MYCIT|nr:IS481 family transposase [Mycobacterium intracellulare]AOS92542.1 IS481 family transposase [Mycobacterium intracellulare subsp. chimaera]ASL13536.1 transposase for ISMyma06 [Mycobacterium intracellulare subsp. chimaera]ASL17462.1 transposase for ISMyma06 [Mycobacterium intracellulare subsp. chimaera]ASQ84923.1 IS481 family transposase [Mycobacterium intracellulare subsp. chimaera]ASQ85678.1 IS481 family transposase [Mycobacterium intracellulare subsp. chimaera]